MTLFSMSHLAANEREFDAEIAATDAGLSATDCTGVITGNADIATPAEWTPYAGPRERAPLPGCEHLQGADLDLIGGAK